MSSSSYCPDRNEMSTCECCWNCQCGLKCDLLVKTSVATRRKREFTPDEQKDENYWLKRSRNNEAAKRSRERRRVEEQLMEARTAKLLRENQKLKATLSALHYHAGGDTLVEYPLLRNLSRDSYMRSLVDIPALNPLSGRLNRLPYALSNRCNFTPAFDSATLHGIDSFSTASYNNVQDQMGIRYLGIPASIEGTGHDCVHPAMNLFDNPAPCLPTEKCLIGTDYSAGQGTQGAHSRDTKGTHSGCICTESKNSQSTSVSDYSPGTKPDCSTVGRDELYLKEGPITKAREISKKSKSNKNAESFSGLKLLPHKLRYKVNKGRYNGDHMLSPSCDFSIH